MAKELKARSFVAIRDVRHSVEDAEKTFIKCWGILAQLRHHEAGSSLDRPLSEFQPTLAAALFRLTHLYARLAKEKQYLIDRKDTYSVGWFAKRMALISRLQEGVHGISEVGRALGDAFAWIFVQNDREFLAQHSREPRPHMPPTGIGGKGELGFIRTVQNIHGCYVLYHGITTYLRLGDITLIDTKTMTVAGIGELKTHISKPGYLTTSVTLVGASEKLRQLASTAVRREIPLRDLAGVPGLSNKEKDRHARQFQRMRKGVNEAAKKADHRMDLVIEGRIDAFADFVEKLKRGRITSRRIGGGLLLAGTRSRASLFAHFFGRHNISEAIDGFDDGVRDLSLPGREDNTLCFGTFFYDRHRSSLLPGMTPLFWWPIPIEVARAILFREALVFTVFNHAHLYQALEDAGFEVVSKYPEEILAERTVGDRGYGANGFAHFVAMIEQYFFDEATIVRALVAGQDQLADRGLEPYTHVTIKILQTFDDTATRHDTTTA